MKISAMNETVCNHLFRDTPWRVSVRLTKTDRRGNLGVFANDFKLQLAERIGRFGTGKQRFYHLYIGGGYFCFSDFHECKGYHFEPYPQGAGERKRLSGVVATPVDGILQKMSC
ncbi:hypothetical protein GT738_08465 [Bifidobacterium pseudocatenulatum]|nr:hypothetical protein [Bifidobacterium pseudocatenulatum]MZS31344.1 hypothetical protein [Bifidobacterium pseudocatenulatum]